MEDNKNFKNKQEMRRNWMMYRRMRGGGGFFLIIIILLIGLILIGTTKATIANQNINGFQILANDLNVTRVLSNPPSWMGWSLLSMTKGPVLQLQFGVAFCVIVTPILIACHIMMMRRKMMMWFWMMKSQQQNKKAES